MIKLKPIFVRGEIINRDGKRVSTLADKIEEAVSDFQSDHKVEIEDVSVPQVDFPGGSSGGQALLLVKYKGETVKPPAKKKR